MARYSIGNLQIFRIFIDYCENQLLIVLKRNPIFFFFFVLFKFYFTIKFVVSNENSRILARNHRASHAKNHEELGRAATWTAANALLPLRLHVII